MIIVAAMDSKSLIGKDGGLPWHIPADLKHFKELTMGAVIIMGSTTWKSFPKALPGRHHVVITRNPDSIVAPEDGCVVGSVEDAIKAAKVEAKARNSEIFIIGGADIYRQTIDLVDRMIITRVWGSHDGDTYFPTIDTDKWGASVYRDLDDVESNGHRFSIFDYRRA